MNLNEKSTDLWVYDLLNEAELKFDPQGSSIKEIDDALKTVSKRGTGKVGFPEYVGKVKDYIIVIEDKVSLSKHENRTKEGLLAEDTASICDFAVNGALFYGKHLIKNTSYRKIIAIGVSGNEKKHRISPVFINERMDYYELPEIETFISFHENNIDEYYTKEILKENAFFTGQNIQVLHSEHLNKRTAMFIIPLLKIQMEKFNWGGNGATLSRLKRTKMLLPTDSKGDPNWRFMEDYIKQEQKEIAQTVISYYEPKMLKTSFSVVGLEDVE